MVYYDVTEISTDNWQPTVRFREKLEDGWQACGKGGTFKECLEQIDDWHAARHGESTPKHITTHSMIK